MKIVHQGTNWPYRELCSPMGIPYSTLMRWKGRLEEGERVIRSPGPRPVELSAGEETRLQDEIARLRHGRLRTAGTGELWRRWRGRISRREFGRRVGDHRRGLRRRARRELTRVRYLMPGALWAMDDMGTCREGKIHHVRDAASRYDLKLLAARHLPGKEVARNLEELIERYGPPLVVKRDNGSNLNHEEVNEVLERHAVIGLNSPPRYPRYNGLIERGQREVAEVKEDLSRQDSAIPREGKTILDLVHEILSRRPRPCLGGETAEDVFQAGRGRMAEYTEARRHAARARIEETYRMTVEREGLLTKRAKARAWRRAVEAWLLQEGIIAIEKGESVTPVPSISV